MKMPFPKLNFVLFLLLGLTACSAEKANDTSAPAALPFSHRFSLDLGNVSPSVQLALSEREKQNGLMHRMRMPADEGMLFVFKQPARQSFWMRNTHIPLDIGYFDAHGVLREIYPMYPLDETPVVSFSKEIVYALEMNQGWFAKNGIGEGMALNLQQILAAIRSRGFEDLAKQLETLSAIKQ